MDPTVAIALIGVVGTLFAGIGAPFASGWLEDRRSRESRRAARVDETRCVLEDATSSFVQARLALDNALFRPGNHELDSDELYAPLAKHESRIALRLGGSHPISVAFDKTIERWAQALNMAATDTATHHDEILSA